MKDNIATFSAITCGAPIMLLDVILKLESALLAKYVPHTRNLILVYFLCYNYS